jgi:Ulp1 family protease
MEKTFFYSTLFEYGYSSKEVQNWIDNTNCSLVKYDRINGNCHVFII